MTFLWKTILVWSIISLAILVVLQNWSEVTFVLTFVVAYGGIVFLMQKRINAYLYSSGLKRFPVYLAVCVLVSVFEEFYVFALGNRIAVPDIWKDIVIVPGEWSVWFATWYLLLAKKYSFAPGEALFAAGFEGIMFEFIGTGLIVADPIGFLISFPLTIIVYAAIFILPMQFLSFSGSYKSKWKLPVSVFLPYVLTIPVTFLLYALVP